MQPPPYGPMDPYGPYGPYQPQPQYQPQVVVRRGIHPAWHVIHGVLTVFSCLLWSPIWFLHWLLGRGRVKVTYR